MKPKSKKYKIRYLEGRILDIVVARSKSEALKKVLNPIYFSAYETEMPLADFLQSKKKLYKKLK